MKDQLYEVVHLSNPYYGGNSVGLSYETAEFIANKLNSQILPYQQVEVFAIDNNNTPTIDELMPSLIEGL